MSGASVDSWRAAPRRRPGPDRVGPPRRLEQPGQDVGRPARDVDACRCARGTRPGPARRPCLVRHRTSGAGAGRLGDRRPVGHRRGRLLRPALGGVPPRCNVVGLPRRPGHGGDARRRDRCRRPRGAPVAGGARRGGPAARGDHGRRAPWGDAGDAGPGHPDRLRDRRLLGAGPGRRSAGPGVDVRRGHLVGRRDRAGGVRDGHPSGARARRPRTDVPHRPELGDHLGAGRGA